MKKVYSEIQLDVWMISAKDVLTTSPNELDDVKNDIFAPNN